MASHGVPRVSGAAVDNTEAAKDKERKQIEQYLALEKNVRQKIKAKDYSNDTFQQTSALLQQNPEYYTIWNYRRLLLLGVFGKELHSGNNTIVDTAEDAGTDADTAAAQKAGLTLAQQEIALLIQEDLQFLIPLLKQYPKCYWIWNHRAWLLATATAHLPARNAAELWKGELALVSKMLALDSRNFHGWSYRREVVGSLEELGGASMTEDEFEYTTKMIKTNLSNFSAWHNRSQLIPKLLEERKVTAEERKDLLDKEWDLITQALYTDPYDQSLWFYHQYLLSTLSPHPQTNRPDYPRSTALLSPLPDTERAHYCSQELDSLREMLEGAEDSKYVYQALLDTALQYLDLQAGTEKVSRKEMYAWLGELRRLDPLREGRWRDLEGKIGVVRILLSESTGRPTV